MKIFSIDCISCTRFVTSHGKGLKSMYKKLLIANGIIEKPVSKGS
tara:strand:- start:35 stop:169 length:135 start_codon:yes stop_codon:yes gene_type:complete